MSLKENDIWNENMCEINESREKQLEREEQYEPAVEEQIAHCPSEVAEEGLKVAEMLSRL
jgi:hypothetical protein